MEKCRAKVRIQTDTNVMVLSQAPRRVTTFVGKVIEPLTHSTEQTQQKQHEGQHNTGYDTNTTTHKSHAHKTHIVHLSLMARPAYPWATNILGQGIRIIW